MRCNQKIRHTKSPFCTTPGGARFSSMSCPFRHDVLFPPNNVPGIIIMTRKPLPPLCLNPLRLMFRTRHRILGPIHPRLLLRSLQNTLPHKQHRRCRRTARQELLVKLYTRWENSLRRLASRTSTSSGCRRLQICCCVAGRWPRLFCGP